MWPSRLGALALLLALHCGCISYEYDHEFWLKVDGSGSVAVTGRPELWVAFKGLPSVPETEALKLKEAARELCESPGVRVRRVSLTHRGGQAYLRVVADFDDVNALKTKPAFADLDISQKPLGDRIILEGTWRRPPSLPPVGLKDETGLVAVRFHLPSRIFSHKNASWGVERGNILSWREDLKAALRGSDLPFGATLGSASIFWSTVGLFGAAILAAFLLMAATLAVVTYRGKRSSPQKPG